MLDQLNEPVSRWMSRGVLSVHEKQSIEDLVTLLGKQQIHGAPVVNEVGELCGVISTTDIVKAGASAGEAPSYFYDGYYPLSQHPFDDVLNREVRDFMSRDLIVCSESDSVARCCEILVERQVHRVIVTSPNKRILGVVSALDLLKAVHSAHKKGELA